MTTPDRDPFADSEPSEMKDDLQPTHLTWAALLAQWMDFAKASVALPKTEEGKRWKQSITPIITLQALTFAMRQLHMLPIEEQAFGRDRAEYMVDQNDTKLKQIWGSNSLPALLQELIEDVRLSVTNTCVNDVDI